ncbi:MAG: AAA family ATPase [Oscillospiraceae bacterium]
MKLSLRNIGKISNAEVEINGITVIAGENNTGKSTIGKALYTLFNSFNNIEEKIIKEKENIIARYLIGRYRIFCPNERVVAPKIRSLIWFVSKEICVQSDKCINDINYLKNLLSPLFTNDAFDNELSDEDKNDILEKILFYLKITDDEIQKTVIENTLSEEFDSQVNNLNNKSERAIISLKFKNKEIDNIDIQIINNRVETIKQYVSVFKNIVYIDNLFILDQLNNRYGLINSRDHQLDLLRMLDFKRDGSTTQIAIEQIIVEKQLNLVLSKLNIVCDGELITENGVYKYSTPKFDEPLSLGNVSLGLKVFIILKTLLMNGSIEENGTIILDEPETHLHPQWQLKLAEVIVLLQKEFKLHILLNTHSPYFLRAIETYSAKYEMADKCKYYLVSSENNLSIVEDVTTNTNKIYELLALSLNTLQNERWSLEND